MLLRFIPQAVMLISDSRSRCAMRFSFRSKFELAQEEAPGKTSYLLEQDLCHHSFIFVIQQVTMEQ